jgi:hypothetical protein
MTTVAAAGRRPGPQNQFPSLGEWVELHQEPCRGGRGYQLLVNHRTQQAIGLTDAEADLCHQLQAGARPEESNPAAGAFLRELAAEGFLAGHPPPARPGRRVTASAAALDVHWNGADRLVRAAHHHGGRYLFHPAAVAAQVVLAVAGLVAVAAAIGSHQAVHLRVHPAQIPAVIGLGLAAVAVHELAHALVVVHYRRQVDAAGIRLHLGTPAFYVQATGALLLTRRQRLIQAAAGVWAEWLFTAVAALVLWLAPWPPAAPIVHRFVLLNAAVIASNLLPFTGLDGSWLLADALRMPDLTRRSQGSLTRLITALAGKTPVTAGDWLLAAYRVLNGIAAAALLVTAGFFWYQLFGDLAGALIRHGPAGWLALAAAAVILTRPALTATAPQLPAAAEAARDLSRAIAFRLQWRWRIPAARHLAATIPQLASLTPSQLGVLAGHLHRTRPRRTRPGHLTGYGMVHTGTLTATTPPGDLVTLTPGSTWHPGYRLHHATSRRTTLITIDTAAIAQLLPCRARRAAARTTAAASPRHGTGRSRPRSPGPHRTSPHDPAQQGPPPRPGPRHLTTRGTPHDRVWLPAALAPRSPGSVTAQAGGPATS